jgi:hypothetical protein
VKSRRSRIRQSQAGRLAIERITCAFSLGGIEKPLTTSRSRRPSAWLSIVSTSAS